jgi:hypothetical protein
MSHQILAATVAALYPTSTLVRSTDTLAEISHQGDEGMYGYVTYHHNELVVKFNARCAITK